MTGDEDDLSNYPAEFADDPPSKKPAPARSEQRPYRPGADQAGPTAEYHPEGQGNKPSEPRRELANITQRAEPRGIGAVHYDKQPIGCVVEILKRGWDEVSKSWIIYPPFDRSTPKDAVPAFSIMTPTTVTTRMIGSRESPSRAPHPAFAAFNTCEPSKAQSLNCKLVHFDEKKAWSFHLGAYKAPQGRKGPERGWWCSGDGEKAVRIENGVESVIKCPARMCEFQQEGSGPRGQGTHCKVHTGLVAQFNWSEKSPLPRIMFEWDSQSYHAYQNIEAVFRMVRETAANLNIKDLPVIGLPIALSVKQTTRNGKRYPEVHASIDGDVMAWIASIRQAMHAGQIAPQLSEGPPPMRALPPVGMSQDDVDRARLSRLDPNYRPQNVE